MTLKAVLFDFDDTLIDVSASRQERARRAHTRLREEGIAVSWGAFWHVINELDEGGFYSKGMPGAIRELGLHSTELGQECVGLWFFQGAEDLLAISPGCTAALDVLSARYRLGVVTNGPAETQRHKFDHTGLHDYFELFLPSGEAGVHKPDPQILRIALDRLGLQPHEAVFIGDHLDLDVICALDAGVRAIWYNPRRRRSHYPYIVPDAVIHGLDELPDLIEKLSD